MPLPLDAREQELLAKALRVCASPLTYERPEDWAHEIATCTRKVVGGAEKGMLEVPPAYASLAVHPGYSAKDIAEYHEYSPLLASAGLFERTARLKVATRRAAYGTHYEAVMQGPLGQDFLPRVKAYDALILTLALRCRPSTQQDVIQLIFNTTSPGRPFTEEQVALARLLFPAFRAGMLVYQQMASIRSSLSTLIDATGGACAAFDLDGQLLHITPRLEELMMREPQREDVMAGLHCLASGLSDPCRIGACTPRTVQGARGAYTLTPSFVRDLAPDLCLLISVTPPLELCALPPPEEVRQRFGLTQQQARVALLLAERRTNRGIAGALAISVHTARHHVEQVLARLGVPRRAVPAVLVRETAGNG